jgi:hypothetical protein
MALGSTQSLTEMSTRDIYWGLRRPVRRADNITTFMRRLSRNSGSLDSLEPSGPVQACTGTAFLQVPCYTITKDTFITLDIPFQVQITSCLTSLFAPRRNA